MIEMVSLNPRISYDWGAQDIDYKEEFDGQLRNKLTFSPDVGFVDGSLTRREILSFEIAYVTASCEEDDAIFLAFNIQLRKTLELCRPPNFNKWRDCVTRPDFLRIERLIVNSSSFEEQFFNKVILAYESDFILFRGTLWANPRKLPREQCEMFLDEFYRRETLHLDRISSEEFFQGATSKTTAREHIAESTRHVVWRRDEGKCTSCGSRFRLEFDHIIPVAMGGGSKVRNLQLLCESCNRIKGATLGRTSTKM